MFSLSIHKVTLNRRIREELTSSFKNIYVLTGMRDWYNVGEKKRSSQK